MQENLAAVHQGKVHSLQQLLAKSQLDLDAVSRSAPCLHRLPRLLRAPALGPQMVCLIPSRAKEPAVVRQGLVLYLPCKAASQQQGTMPCSTHQFTCTTDPQSASWR